MNADLMGSTGFKPAFDQRSMIQHRKRSVMGDRVLAAPLFNQRHFLAIIV